MWELISCIPWSYIFVFLFGILFTCLLQATLVYFYFLSNSSSHHNFSSVLPADTYTFPQQLLEIITEKIGENTSEGTVVLNLLLQFWFHENRYNVPTLNSIGDKLNNELTELLTNTSLGKVFSSLKIHDIELGSQSPSISNVSLKSVNINKELKTLNSFVFEFDVNYVGGFYMSIDAVMKFNSNTAFVAVKVDKCIGKVHVEFTRLPYTYWCMSFVQQPELELNVESRLEGRSVPQLNKIIGIQIRRRINRKFVLPYYKIRTKPFLPTYNAKLYEDDVSATIESGVLDITFISLSRLPVTNGSIYCTIFVDSNRWIEDVQLASMQTHILYLFKRSNKDLSPSCDVRKLSTSSILQDRYQEGLRQRFQSITGIQDGGNSCIDEILRRNSSFDPSSSFNKCVGDADSQNDSNDNLFTVCNTKQVPYNELITFNENFQFNIEPSMRFLNILVWNRLEDNSNSNLIGFVSLPLVTEICAVGTSKKHRLFYLKPSVNTRNTGSYQTLSSHSGFNSSLCYGDVFISFKFISASSLSSSSRSVSSSPTKSASKSSFIDAESTLPDIDSELTFSTHQFDKIIITRPTMCNFCSRKIWWKDAFKCSKCNYVCHKKCISKCEKNSECSSTNDAEQLVCAEEALNLPLCADVPPRSSNPEIITTAPESNGNAIPNAVPMKKKFSTFLANVKGVRRTGSSTSLAPPNQIVENHNNSNSLPQTVEHSPHSSRKPSISSAADVILFQSIKNDDEVEKALTYLLSMPHSENVLESVKNSGKKLCMDLSPNERETRINEVISSIKTHIDLESNKYCELSVLKDRAVDGPETARIAFQIGKCEERLQALTNLLLHCCSGLQDSQDVVKSQVEMKITETVETFNEEELQKKSDLAGEELVDAHNGNDEKDSN